MKWPQQILKHNLDHPGIIINAVQRHLQFDTFAGAIEAESLDTLFTEKELALLIEQAITFYADYRVELSTLPHKEQEEMIRAALGHIITTPESSHDLWHAQFAALHAGNNELYNKLGTPERVLQLIERFECADIIATSISHYQSKEAMPYTPMELIKWVVKAKNFYETNQTKLAAYSAVEQRHIISDFLAGRSSIAW